MSKNKGFVVMTFITLVGLVFLSPGVLRAQAAPPNNDDFDMATVIAGLPFSDTLNTTEATMAVDDPDFGCGSQTSSVWYTFTPFTDIWIYTDTNGSSYNTSLGVFTGTRGSLSLVTNNCSSGSTQFQAVAGVTYYFMIDGWYSGYPAPTPGGDLAFHVSEIPSPANDNFANATVVSALPFSEQADTNWATTEAGEPNSLLCRIPY